ncbi:hypothetical protein BGX26_004857, partial [Mortierella sp. AD094]
MIWYLFSSHLPVEEILDAVDENLEKASKTTDPTSKLKLCSNAKAKMKYAGKRLTKSEKGEWNHETSRERIAKAYYEHSLLLKGLNEHKKAQKSEDLAKMWGYCPTVGEETPPSSHPSRQVPAIPVHIFANIAVPPVVKHQLPGVGERIQNTTQLTYCLSLIGTLYDGKLDQLEQVWLNSIREAPHEKERLQTLASDLVRTFVRDELKSPEAVKEVVCLSPVLGQEDFRKVLQTFVDSISRSTLQDDVLHVGLAQLLRNSSLVHIDVDDLVKMLEVLGKRLQNTHPESKYQYQLALTTSRVLDNMMDTKVNGLSREGLHSPLLECLNGLRRNSDPYLAFQASYAHQALLYIPNDESPTQAVLRRTGMVIQGISGIVSAVKAIDLNRFVEGLNNIQQGFPVLGAIANTAKNVWTFGESGQDFFDCIKEAFELNSKSVWYPALRGLDSFLQEGRLAEFEKLIRDAPCKKHPLFQWG